MPSGRRDINVRTVLACRESGVHFSRMSKLFSIMCFLAPMHHKTYQEISSEVNHAAVSATSECMKQASDVIRLRHESQAGPSTRDSTVPEITVDDRR